MPKRKRRSYTDEFKREAVRLVTEQGYSLAEAARKLGMHTNLLSTWKRKLEAETTASEAGLTEEERMELASLRATDSRLRRRPSLPEDILEQLLCFV